MTKNRVVSNASWIIGCKIVKAILTMIVTMITARYLGPSNYGLISYAASIVTFVAPIMKLGFDFTLVHEIVNNKDKEGRIIGTAMFLNLCSGFICILGIVAFTYIANRDEKDTIIVCTLYSILLLFQAVEMIQYWFQAKLQSKYSAIAMLIAYIFVTIFQIFLLVTQKSVYWFALSNSIDFGLIAIMLILQYYKLGGQKLSIDLKIGKNMFRKSKYYIVSNLMVTIFAQTDKIMLKLMVDNEAVGLYSAATTCACMASFVFAAIIDSARPSIFESKKISHTQYENGLVLLYSVITYVSIAFSLILTIFAPLIIHIMYGSGYTQSIQVLRIVVWFTTFSYLGTARLIWIISEQKEKYLWIINLSGALMNIIINLLLIPSIGVLGAAIASLITQIFVNYIIGFIMPQIKGNNRLILKSLNPRVFISGIKSFLK